MGRKAKSTISWLITRATRRGRVLLVLMSFMAVRGSVARARALRRASEMYWSLCWSGTLT